MTVVVDPALEAKAKTGDVVAACTLVANDLRQCQAYRTIWRLYGDAKPQCLDDAVPRAHEGYLSEAVDEMPAGVQKDAGKGIVRDLILIQTLYRVDESNNSAAGDQIAGIVATCPLLAQ